LRPKVHTSLPDTSNPKSSSPSTTAAVKNPPHTTLLTCRGRGTLRNNGQSATIGDKKPSEIGEACKDRPPAFLAGGGKEWPSAPCAPCPQVSTSPWWSKSAECANPAAICATQTRLFPAASPSTLRSRHSSVLHTYPSRPFFPLPHDSTRPLW